MIENLIWISSRLLISKFISWAEEVHHVKFNQNLFRRAKVRTESELTDRQKLLCSLAGSFVEQQKRTGQTSPA